MKNKQLAMMILGAGAVLLLMQSQSNQQQVWYPQGGGYYYNFPDIPPAPSTAQAFQQWVDAITSAYGNIAALWQPGGPFYQNPPGQGPV